MTAYALRQYETIEACEARIEVLLEKANAIHFYNRSVDAGSPNLLLLDLKQRAILAERAGFDGRFTGGITRSIGRCIDILHTRILNLREAEAIAQLTERTAA